MNIARHQRAEDDDPGAAPRPRTSRRAATSQVVERVLGPALPEKKATPATTATAEQRRARASSRPGPATKLIARTSAPTRNDREDAAEVVDRLGRLVDVGGDERDRQQRGRATASGSVTRKTEPQSKCSSSAPETSGPSAAIAPPSADQSAIAFVRAGAGPERRDQRERGRVGHAGGEPADDARDEEHLDRRARTPARSEAGIDSAHPEHEHQLAAVAVAERAELEHRRREPERVADGDEVERRSARRRRPRRCPAARRSRPTG